MSVFNLIRVPRNLVKIKKNNRSDKNENFVIDFTNNNSHNTKESFILDPSAIYILCLVNVRVFYDPRAMRAQKWSLELPAMEMLHIDLSSTEASVLFTVTSDTGPVLVRDWDLRGIVSGREDTRHRQSTRDKLSLIANGHLLRQVIG